MDAAPKSALVTGGAAGIGFEIACLLVDRGYGITILDLDQTLLVAAKHRLEARRPRPSMRIATTLCDVTHAADLGAAVRLHLERFGGSLDVLVNNAGVAERGDFLTPSEASNWRAVLDVDLAAVVEGTRLGIRAMTKGRGGTIVNVASAGGLFPMPFSPVYAAAKAGVVMLCRSLEGLAFEKTTPVVVRAFCPQFVDTAFVARASEEVMRVHAVRGEGATNAAVGSSSSHSSSPTGSSSSNGSSPSSSPSPGDSSNSSGPVGSAPTFKELVAATGGRLLTAREAASACVEELVDRPPHEHGSSALLLTTSGPKWWAFDAAGRRRAADPAAAAKSRL
jgi:NAD(P)-dependent dehydrogenase (short-subunit alcohol dehydrogenase family)